MFASIMLNPAWPTSRPLIIGSGGTAIWGELADRVPALERDLRKRVHACQRVGLVFRVGTTSLAALAVLDRLACDTFILDGMLAPEPAVWLGADLGLGLVLVPSGSSLEALVLPATDKPPGSTRSTVTILTSGTTGRPKPVGHTWASLNRPVRVHADDPPHAGC